MDNTYTQLENRTIIASLLFLVIGLVYYFFSGSEILFFGFLNIKFRYLFPLFIHNYFSDICFTIFFILNIHILQIKAGTIKSMYLSILPIFFEISQFFFQSLGTFDLVDLMIFSVPLLYLYFSKFSKYAI